jgi:hypothetical protein
MRETKILTSENPPVVKLELLRAPVITEVRCDVLADLNREGNWVRGFELLGSSSPFSLARALTPFLGKGAQGSTPIIRATYDEQADAGFVYLPELSKERRKRDPALAKPFNSVEDEAAVLGLDAAGGLVSIRFALPEGQSVDRFVELYAGYKAPAATVR